MKTPLQVLPESHGTTSTQGTSVSGGSGAGVYTATKVQLVASTSMDWAGLVAMTSGGTTIGSLWKLYVGASGSEVEVAEFIGTNGPTEPMPVFLPIAIPAGSRISAAKADGDGFGQAARIHLVPVRGRSFDPMVSRGTLIGAGTGALTDADAGATANTKGAWAQLIASTVREAKGFTLLGWGDTSSSSSVRFHADVGVGAAGSEQIVLADVALAQEGFRVGLRGTPIGPIWTPIPAGSRIAVRAQCSSAAASDRVPRFAIVLWE